MNTKRFVIVTLASALLFAPALLVAQQDQDNQDNVVDAARKAQAEKKTAPKAKMVIDDDNLNTLKGTISVVGPAPAAPEDQSKIAAADTTKAPTVKPAVKDEAYWRQTFADAYKKLADDAHELDILQREFNLKQEQFYTDPMASLKQGYSRQDLTDSKQKIDDKTAVVAQDKQAISDLEDALHQAGGDPGWATPPSTGSAPASESSSTPPATPAPASGIDAVPPAAPAPAPPTQ